MFSSSFPASVPIYANQSNCVSESNESNVNAKKTDDQIIGNNRALLVTDNDPFSPRMKKFDPFEDDFSKSSSAFNFSFSKGTKSTILPDTRIGNEDKPKYGFEKRLDDGVFNGPLQKLMKRDSNMRRLQESDSYSENETVPEPPPRPETSQSQAEPPPLPPKKQFSDIVIRPRITSPLAMNNDTSNTTRHANVSSMSDRNVDSDNPPMLPLPSRRIGRGDAAYPGPGRPEKKREDDYLTPISGKNDVPLLQPPPKTKGSIKNRNRRADSSSPNLPDSGKKDDSENTLPKSIPDITLSQLLTLGIDDLASKLNVPSSKLNTMTIVELTRYLSDYIEKSSQKSVVMASDAPHSVPALSLSTSSIQQSQVPPPPLKKSTESAVFKVSFDDSNDATFIAKFDDNFGLDGDFIPNFDHFNRTHNSSVDKYAVFREIIDQEMHSDTKQTYDPKQSDGSNEASSDTESPVNDPELVPMTSRIDTKITEAISQAKDRYAALRDIILVEDLFEKPTGVNETAQNEDVPEPISENMDTSFNEEIEKDFGDVEPSSPEANISINLKDYDESDPLKTATPQTISQPILSSKDDLEIDEYMNRAISNLSLDSRDHLSPMSKSPAAKSQNASTSPLQLIKKSPIADIDEEPAQENNASKATLNDMSTSPIPLQTSPNPTTLKPLNSTYTSNNGKLSPHALPATKSPYDARTMSEVSKKGNQSQPQEESWAVFDSEKAKQVEPTSAKSPRGEPSKMVPESPYSSDDKADWKVDSKKWPKGQTSSSSRDLSPWDDDAPEYKSHRISSHPDRHGFYMRHARRMNSCDDEYEYEGDVGRRRETNGMRRNLSKASNRSRENFDSDSQNWYHSGNHRAWSPHEDENCDHGRSFDRCLYERSTYGPPYEKRDMKSMPYSSERHLYKGYDKRKYYRDYARPYDVDDYDEYDQRKGSRKEYLDEIYDSSSNYGMRSKAAKDYFYEKHSFDRDSTESFDSSGRRRKSFGSGCDVYSSLDYRERYSSADRKRALRKANKSQRSNEDEYEQDSDGDAGLHRPPTETRSLQRRPRKSSGSSPWDGESEMAPTTAQRSWKRPASASESERKLAESRRLNQAFSGSDGEKDRRFFRKPRSRDREVEMRSNYATMRYPSASRGEEYDYDGPEYDEEDEEQFRDVRRKDRTTANFNTVDHRRKFEQNRNIESMHRMSRSNRDVYYQSEKDRYCKFDSAEQTPKSASRSSSRRERDFNYESYEDTPHPNVGTSKFDFEVTDQGFESDFNTAPEKNLRFSTDFSIDKPPTRIAQNQQSVQPTTGSSELTSTPPQQKLRFDDKITVSKFDLFEDDDFSKAEFSFENEDQWVEELPKKINLKNVTSVKRHENMKKSESINIFARNKDDPFEDDDFFKKSSEQNNNFAKFEDNL